MNVDDTYCKVGEVHPCWKTVANSTREVRRAIAKVRLLTGTYSLQNTAKFKNGAVTDLFQVCSAVPEDRVHFIYTLVHTRYKRQHSKG